MATRLMVFGDLHGSFDLGDERALEASGADAAIFVGDLGEEDPRMIARVPALRVPSYAILGNHDVRRAARRDRVTRMQALEALLGTRNLAYAARPLDDFSRAGGLRPGAKSSSEGAPVLVGGRPFSAGGSMRRSPYLARRYGVRSEADSAAAIVRAAEGFLDRPLVLVAHNGPTGLGEERDAPFGRDFRKPAIDFGDEDLELAIRGLQARGAQVPLVLAGHMHAGLRGGGERRRVGRLGDSLVVNAAVFPRHLPRPQASRAAHSLLITLDAEGVSELLEQWHDADGRLLRSSDLLETLPAAAEGASAEGPTGPAAH